MRGFQCCKNELTSSMAHWVIEMRSRRSREEQRKSRLNAKTQNPQSSIIKQRTIENLKHTRAHSHMITTKIAHVVALNERNPTLQKWVKFVDGALSYDLLKILSHSNSWIWSQVSEARHLFAWSFTSHFNNSMCNEWIWFIFVALNFSHWGLQYELF